MSRSLPLLGLALSALLAAACAKPIAYRYWNVYSMVEPVTASDKTYRDENIAVRFWIDEKKIHLWLENLTGEPMVIDWAGGEFVNVDGVEYSIANIDSIFTGGRGGPAPTTIPPGGKIADLVAPVANVEKLEEWTWYVYPLFNLVDKSAYDNKGKIFGLNLPIRAKGEWKTYSFRFEVTNVVPIVRRAG
ncbi:MAG: hypothetical protein ACNS63_00525 [Candidatus Nitrospinota bacterium M3_3B_026]